MKYFIAPILLIFIIASCEAPPFDKVLDSNQPELDTRCQLQFVKSQLMGEVNASFEADGNTMGNVIAYSTPSGMYVIGKHNGINLSFGIPRYTGPGDYAVSMSNTITIDVAGDNNKVITYIANSGVITLQEFVSPTNEICMSGVFSFEACIEGKTSGGVISVVNGEFEATIS
ncbi:MAG: hypothetical protein ABJF11_00285 [Reichenbachiella sp.]|uniref:hypothetical protein n=1 Tax=Reichenbachiella sp. TaxID=2184521 RepID=UPI003263846F